MGGKGNKKDLQKSDVIQQIKKQQEKERMEANQALLKFDKNKKLLSNDIGPRYLIMRRTDANTDMKSISPVLLDRVLNSRISGDLDEIKMLRDGTLLMKTNNVSQAKNLIQISCLPGEINVSVSEHERLNTIKGVIFNRDLVSASDEELLEQLKTQKVTEIKRLKKKIDGNEISTGTFFLTFNGTTLPEDVKAGYSRHQVRPFIPNPTQCYSCYKFGHTQMTCKNQKKCGICGEESHLTAGEKCEKPMKCINCKSTKHHSFDKKCPEYVKQKEIQTIRVLEKKTISDAVKLFNMRFPSTDMNFSETLRKGLPPDCKCVCNCKVGGKNEASTSKQREFRKRADDGRDFQTPLKKTRSVTSVPSRNNSQNRND